MEDLCEIICIGGGCDGDCKNCPGNEGRAK